MKPISSGPVRRVLSIDIGGTGLKASLVDARGRLLVDPVRVDTPYPCTPAIMTAALVKLVAPLKGFDRISIGFPGVVRRGRVVTAPHFGTKDWAGFALASEMAKRLGKPVRLINDAEMQGLAVIRSEGLELVVTLGTGVGTALFRDGELMPHMELAHHPVHGKKTYNDYIGNKALESKGKKKWNERVRKVIDILRSLLNYDRIYIGGGNGRHVDFPLDRNMTIVPNRAGIAGGSKLWTSDALRESSFQ